MPVTDAIPLPGSGGEGFGEGVDIFNKLLQGPQKSQELQQKIQEMMETAKYHQGLLGIQQQEQNRLGAESPLKMELLRARIEQAKNIQNNPKLSAQERTQAMKLLEAGRSIQGIATRGHKLSSLLEENPQLTGWIPGTKAAFNRPGEKLGEFIPTTAELQAGIGRLASQRGGAQVLKWAERVKPSAWKDVESNKGVVNSLLEDAKSDFEETKNEYESLTGQSYPIQFPQGNPTGTTTMYKNGNEYHIPSDQVEAAKKKGYTSAK